jgi:hypothetical protein
MCLTLTTVSLA